MADDDINQRPQDPFDLPTWLRRSGERVESEMDRTPAYVGATSPFLMRMMAQGAKTMGNWLGSTRPTQVGPNHYEVYATQYPQDILAPLGAAGMTSALGAVPKAAASAPAHMRRDMQGVLARATGKPQPEVFRPTDINLTPDQARKIVDDLGAPPSQRPEDILAPLGAAGMTSALGAVPKAAIGSAGGKLPAAKTAELGAPAVERQLAEAEPRITAYHGSPHRDITEFVTPTFFGSEGIAKIYRKEGGGQDNLNRMGGFEAPPGWFEAHGAMDRAGQDRLKAVERLHADVKEMSDVLRSRPENYETRGVFDWLRGRPPRLKETEAKYLEDYAARQQEAIDYLESGRPLGAVYEVSIPAPTAHYSGNQRADIADAIAKGHKVVTWGGKVPDYATELIALDPKAIDIKRMYADQQRASAPGVVASALEQRPEDILARARNNYANVRAQETPGTLPVPSYPEPQRPPAPPRPTEWTVRPEVIEANPPRSMEGASLSQNLSPGGDAFSYLLYRDGRPIGDMSGKVQGSRAHIDWIGNEQLGPHALGVSGLRQIREQMRADFPEVKVFEGRRISGARHNAEDTTQSVTMLADQQRASAPGVVAGALEQRPETFIVRGADGLGDPAKFPSEAGRIYRGMEAAEYDATLGAGKPIKSRGDYSHGSEGTKFGDDFATAESYANFGRSDPRKTGQPTYIVEVDGARGLTRDPRDGYWQALDSIPVDQVTRAWRMAPGADGSIVATRILADQQRASAPGVVAGALEQRPDTIRGYHGSDRGFKTMRESDTGGNYEDLVVPHDGVWFADAPARAEYFAKRAARMHEGDPASTGPAIYPAELAFKNPYRHPAGDFANEGVSSLPPLDDLRALGHDGAIVPRARWINTGYEPGDFRLVVDGNDYVALQPGTVFSKTTGAQLYADQAKGSMPGIVANAAEQSKVAGTRTGKGVWQPIDKAPQGELVQVRARYVQPESDTRWKPGDPSSPFSRTHVIGARFDERSGRWIDRQGNQVIPAEWRPFKAAQSRPRSDINLLPPE